MENRLQTLRAEIDRLIKEKQPDKARYFYVHLYSVSHFCTLLAIRRGLDAELAATCGMLHDIYPVVTGKYENHAEKGAEQAEIILRTMNHYSEEEIRLITSAIAKHSDKDVIHKPYDELLKDSDVMHHCLYDPDIPVNEFEVGRYKSLLVELGCLI